MAKRQPHRVVFQAAGGVPRFVRHDDARPGVERARPLERPETGVPALVGAEHARCPVSPSVVASVRPCRRHGSALGVSVARMWVAVNFPALFVSGTPSTVNGAAIRTIPSSAVVFLS